jgi:hypothetical protein
MLSKSTVAAIVAMEPRSGFIRCDRWGYIPVDLRCAMPADGPHPFGSHTGHDVPNTECSRCGALKYDLIHDKPSDWDWESLRSGMVDAT